MIDDWKIPNEGLIAVFDPPTETTGWRNYAEGARCGRPKGHDGSCSQVSRWVKEEDQWAQVVQDLLTIDAQIKKLESARTMPTHAVDWRLLLRALLQRRQDLRAEDVRRILGADRGQCEDKIHEMVRAGDVRIRANSTLEWIS